jgi:amino acid adenylation domain-containing protein/FkbM family methyltransferase
MDRPMHETLEGFRLSPQQRRSWAERQLHGAGWHKTVVAVVMEGELSPEALRAAVAEVISRHEILRTRFQTPPGETVPLQVIGEPPPADEAPPAALGVAGGERLEEVLDAAWNLPLDPLTGEVLKVAITPLAERRHLVVAVFSALVCDAAAALQVMREVARVYAGDGGADVEPLQYADLAEWQNGFLESAEAQAGRSYWADLRWDEFPGASLPFQRQGTVPPFSPRAMGMAIDAATARGLDEAAVRCGASLRVLLLTCWQVLLARLGNGDDFVLGVVHDGRRYPELAEAVGPFARCLPSPYRLDPALLLREQAARTAELDTVLAGWQESFPIDRAAGAAFPAVRFGFAATGRGDLLAGGPPTVRLERIRSYGERFALALECTRATAGLGVELHYDAAQLPREAVALLAGRFARLLQSAVEDLSRPVATLEILPEEERRQVLTGFNPAAAALPDATCLHEIFAGWAAREPQRLAVVSAGRRSTYGELNAQANRLGRHLQALGAGAEKRVALCLERSTDLLVALLAVLKTGAAFVPLDPAFPPERMALMLGDSGARLLVSTSPLLSSLSTPGVQQVALDIDTEEIARRAAHDLDVAVDPSCLAYAIFTSGSTGRPKGVGVEHRQLFHYVRAVLARLDPPAGASFAAVSTFAADLGYTAVFSSLATGGRLLLVPAEQAADPEAMAACFRSHPVDVLKITPSHLAALLVASSGRDLIPRCRLVLGGEALTWELIDRIRALAPGCTILNHYGPTESTVGASTFQVPSVARDEAAGTVPLGQPLEHARAYVLDAVGLPVPLGVPGELHIGGAGLSRGYLNDPRLTAERFVPDPYGAEPGARLYRTGDRARWLLSGDLEFLGRVDEQLKIRGFRVEPGEIEKTLERHPAVATAKVVGREEASGDLRLAAYVTVDAQHAGPVHRLLHLRDQGDLRDQPLFELPNGMTVAHVNDSETRFLYREIFGERTYLQHGIQIPDGACVVDVGASIGLFSLLAVQAARGVRVFAFEPVPRVFRALRLNAEIYGGIQAFEVGLSRERRRAEITCYPHMTLMSSLYADPAEERQVVRSFLRQSQTLDAAEEAPAGGLLEELLQDRLSQETATIELRRLSDIFREQAIQHVDLLKIDVQKSEHDVLAGIDEEDWPKIQQVVLEVHDIAGRLGEITRLLESKGFAVAVEQEQALAGTPLYDVYARRPSAATASGIHGDRPPASPWSTPVRLVEELQKHLQAALPEPMVPSSLSLLARLPLMPNGKLDRCALPEPESVSFATRRTYELAKTETEKKLAEIWSAVLGSLNFGIRDNFFQIGGHSLLVARALARIRQVFAVEVTLRDFFDHPTIAVLARRIETAEPLVATQEERIHRLVRAAYRQSQPPLDGGLMPGSEE